MSFHHDPQGWLRQAQRDACPYCNREEDPSQSEIIHSFQYAQLCAHPRVCLPGTCYLVTWEHYVAFYDLPEGVLLGFMQEVQTAARILQEVTGAFHINYEIHGNTVPHLHLHLFPRYLDDPFGGMPIDFRRVDPPVYREGEFQGFVSRMRARLQGEVG